MGPTGHTRENERRARVVRNLQVVGKVNAAAEGRARRHVLGVGHVLQRGAQNHVPVAAPAAVPGKDAAVGLLERLELLLARHGPREQHELKRRAEPIRCLGVCVNDTRSKSSRRGFREEKREKEEGERIKARKVANGWEVRARDAAGFSNTCISPGEALVLAEGPEVGLVGDEEPPQQRVEQIVQLYRQHEAHQVASTKQSHTKKSVKHEFLKY